MKVGRHTVPRVHILAYSSEKNRKNTDPLKTLRLCTLTNISGGGQRCCRCHRRRGSGRCGRGGSPYGVGRHSMIVL